MRKKGRAGQGSSTIGELQRKEPEMKEKHLQDSEKQSVKYPRHCLLCRVNMELSNPVKVPHTALMVSPWLIMYVFAVTQV